MGHLFIHRVQGLCLVVDINLNVDTWRSSVLGPGYVFIDQLSNLQTELVHIAFCTYVIVVKKDAMIFF